MPKYPMPPKPPCWAIFDTGGLQGAYFWAEIDPAIGLTEEQATGNAFAALNDNRDSAEVYIVKCLWSNSNNHNTFYEQSDRVYAPMGEEPDKTPPE